MKSIIVLLCLFSGLGLGAQNRGIDFRSIEWKKALKLAKSQKRLIFVDCYTSWCGPCKMLAKNVFTQDSVADYFNRNFVCLKMDMEKEGKELVAGFKVNAYPTLLFIEPQSQQVVHRLVGAGNADWLLAGGSAALNPQRSLYALNQRYRNGEKEPEFMAVYLKALLDGGLRNTRDSVMDSWFRTLTDEEFVSPVMWGIVEIHFDDKTNPIGYCFNRFAKLHRRFYEFAVTQRVNLRLSIVIQNNMARYVRWNPAGNKAFDEKGYTKMVEYLKSLDYERTPFWLAQMYTAGYMAKRDYKGMFESIKDALKYHFMAEADEQYYLMLFLPRFTLCEDTALMQEVETWLTEWLNKHPEDKLLQGVRGKLFNV